MKKTNLILITFLSLAQSISFASVEVDPLIAKCHATPKINTDGNRPEEFNSNNNLRRHRSSMRPAKGEQIIVAGRVMDKNCIPVMGATLKVWQRNSLGAYQNSSNSKFQDPNFLGNGITNTDNLGRFNFLTVLPGATKNSLPSMNIEISHDKLHKFTTKIFFNHKKKNVSKVINKNTAQVSNINEDNSEKIYYIDLVFDEALPNKSY